MTRVTSKNLESLLYDHSAEQLESYMQHGAKPDLESRLVGSSTTTLLSLQRTLTAMSLWKRLDRPFVPYALLGGAGAGWFDAPARLFLEATIVLGLAVLLCCWYAYRYEAEARYRANALRLQEYVAVELSRRFSRVLADA